MIIIGGLQDFINYAVLGIKTFSNSIPYISLLQEDKMSLRILSIVVPITLFTIVITMLILNISNKKSRNIDILSTLFCYSLSIIIVMYPIADEIHFLLGSFITIIELIYILYLITFNIYEKVNIKSKLKVYKIVTLFIWLLIAIVVSETTLTKLYAYTRQEKNKDIAHYKYVEVEEDMRKSIKVIDNYILQEEHKGNNVYILDAEAAIYMIPINKYNKNYDMFLKGNLGKDGEKGIIEKLNNEKNKNNIYIIRNIKIEQNWQTPIEVINYIRNNYKKIGEIQHYEIYK